ncbi:MAG: SOS response-associated peptidase [Leptospiraceae bacterium]|nr:SOS response-associated peptidase [Leptospiraceae bacterium]MDW8306536.1 SOS response-associated peptidase family protein [Leptospiraceae bacterium]
MCARYELLASVKELKDYLGLSQEITFPLPQKEIFPSESALVLTPSPNMMELTIMNWGFSFLKEKKRSLVFNIRVESFSQKPYFQKLAYQNRCVVPATAFFEWQKKGIKGLKWSFTPQDGKFLFFAAIYRKANPLEFAIITCKAKKPVTDIHDRMPLLLPKDYVKDYLHFAGSPEELLPFLDKLPVVHIKGHNISRDEFLPFDRPKFTTRD